MTFIFYILGDIICAEFLVQYSDDRNILCHITQFII